MTRLSRRPKPQSANMLTDELVQAYDSEGADGARRKAAVAHLKATLEARRAAVRAKLEGGEWDGIAAAARLSQDMDEIVSALYALAIERVFPVHSPTDTERLAVVAVGGYGRGLLAPGSDIDLMFLLPYKQTSWGESVAEFVLYGLWDLGLKVGHSTRSIDQAIRFSRADNTVCTALLEARFIDGTESLFREFRKRFGKEIVAQGGEDFVEAKLAERDQRHARAGESRYLVEPNIKDGKGGLRDLHSLFWIAKYVYRVDDAAELVALGLFTREEYLKFAKAERFLWTVRCHLHFMTGRAEERLTFDVQREMARRLGYKDHGDGLRRVERFMKHYFLIAKDVGDLSHIFCSALEDQNKKRRPSLGRFLPSFGRRREVGAFIVEGGRLDVASPDAFKTDPVNFLRAFHLSDAEDLVIHPNALKLMRRSLKLVDPSLMRNDEANGLFLEILSSRKDPERTLRGMNEAGVLGHFVPEFGRVVAMMQFNMYHHYTVDEHLIRAVGHLAQIERDRKRSDFPLATDLFQSITNRSALYVAIFLHDIAKGRPKDHSAEGAEIAARLGPRFGLSAAETDMVVCLVQHHLLMSDVAQKRDISDTKTVRDFAKIVQSPERLKLLLILTVADIRAVGPGTWNAWKGQLLRELYFETEAVLQGGHSVVTRVERVLQAKALLAERLSDVKKVERDALLERHYPPYWLSTDLATQEKHARMMLEADRLGRNLTILHAPIPDSAATEVTIYTPDHPGLFSRLAGSFAMSGASIVDAKIFTTTHGMALDIFTIQDADGGAFGDETRLQRLERTIEGTLKGEVRAHEVVAGRKPRQREQAFTVEPTVFIDNSASESYTVIEVNGADRPGLLHDLTRALFNLSLSITSARIATYGERVVDVFYVKDGFGLKVVSVSKLKKIEAKLLECLGGEPSRGGGNRRGAGVPEKTEST